jgi:hypothetical protein
VSGVATSYVVKVTEQTGHFTESQSLLLSADECPATCSASALQCSSLALPAGSSSLPLPSLISTFCTPAADQCRGQPATLLLLFAADPSRGRPVTLLLLLLRFT